MTTSALPVTRASELPVCAPEHAWLIHDLWADQAVGIVGGEPKCGKSFLALDMVVAVAAGVPCLRRFPASRIGPVLLYAAEDALHVVRTRLEGICRAAAVTLADLPIHVITAPSLRLDRAEDCQQLQTTVATLRPILLVLDPFVRLHRIDENASCEVAPLLAYLRELQRRFALAVVLVHHPRKGAGTMRGGQALRGSSELHAWGDSNLYLRRVDERLFLSIEHRAAPSRAGSRSRCAAAATRSPWRSSTPRPSSTRRRPRHRTSSRMCSPTPIGRSPSPSSATPAACARPMCVRPWPPSPRTAASTRPPPATSSPRRSRFPSPVSRRPLRPRGKRKRETASS